MPSEIARQRNGLDVLRQVAYWPAAALAGTAALGAAAEIVSEQTVTGNPYEILGLAVTAWASSLTAGSLDK